MFNPSLIGAVALAAIVTAGAADAQTVDPAKYPEFAGQWVRNTGTQWDPTKPHGIKQQAPLIPEYQALFEANLADLAKGGEGYNPQLRCFPGGMPRMMIAYDPLQLILTPQITYIWVHQNGRVSPNLHGRTRLAGQSQAGLSGLFDRPMGG